MKYLLTGAAAVIGLFAVAMGMADEAKTKALLTGLIGGTVAMFLVALSGRALERRESEQRFSSRTKRCLLGVFAISAATAKALFMFILGAVAVGALVGLACYAAIKMWSAMLTIEHRVNDRNEVAAVTASEPWPELAARPAVVETMVEESSQQFENVLISTRPWLWLTRPVGAVTEYSTNLTEWIEWDGEPKNGDAAFWRVAAPLQNE